MVVVFSVCFFFLAFLLIFPIPICYLSPGQCCCLVYVFVMTSMIISGASRNDGTRPMVAGAVGFWDMDMIPRYDLVLGYRVDREASL